LHIYTNKIWRNDIKLNFFKSKYVIAFITSVKNVLEYKFNFFIGIISMVFPIIMQYFFWTAVFKSNINSKIYGYTYSQIMIYSLLATLVSRSLSTRSLESDITNDIRTGSLNNYIVKPINYLKYRVIYYFGEKIFAVVFTLTIMSVLGVIVKVCCLTKIYIEPSRIILFIITLFLAWTMKILLCLCISAIAFFIIETGSLFIGFQLFIDVASGSIIPVDILQSRLSLPLNILPFKYIVYYPISIINNRITFHDIVEGLIMQCVWICILFTISRLLWNNCMKKYVPVGG